MTVHVSALGLGRFGRRTEGWLDLAAEAATLALEGLGRKPVDLLVVGSMLTGAVNGLESTVPRLASRIGMESTAGFRVDAASASGAAAFQAAVLAIESGRYERALVVAAEKMTGPPTPEVTRALANSLHPSEVAAGATMPGLAALIAQRYCARYGVSPSVFDLVSVHMRARAALNPNAQFQTPVRADEVSASRPVALPLRLLHCPAISDGAVALVVEKGAGPASVLGFGQGLDAMRLIDRVDLTTFAATRVAARRAYEMARITRKELEVIELHDAFAPFALIDLEDLGVCGPGEAGNWFAQGWVAPDGRLPVNPSGGVLGRGHPIGASGLAEIAEVACQLRGEAGPRALPRLPRIGLAQSIGGMASHNFVTILGREAS
ncbi:MAG TPA: thiolase family protein [Thermoplasmata archaeon]|nr:thiolase family protein [Thermoplasmata archaeon]